MYKIVKIRLEYNYKIGKYDLPENVDNCYIFLHFHTSCTFTFKGEKQTTVPNSFLIYKYGDTRYNFYSHSVLHDYIVIQGEINDLLRSSHISLDDVFTSLFNISNDIHRLEIEFFGGQSYRDALMDLELKALFIRLQRAIPGLQPIGLIAKKLLHNFDFNNIWNISESYPVLRVFEGKRKKSSIWNGEIKKPCCVIEDEIQITCAEELAYIIKNGANGNKYKITTDIYLNDITKFDWKTGECKDEYELHNWFLGNDVPAFNGSLDGDGHIIYGLYCKTNVDKVSFNEWMNIGCGLVPKMGNSIIKNIGIEYSYLNHYTNISMGILVGHAHQAGAGNIEQCYVGNTVTAIGHDVGGIIGGGQPIAPITIKNCYSLANINGDRHIGAILGHSWTLNDWFIEKCFCYGLPHGSNWRAPTTSDIYITSSNSVTPIHNVASIKNNLRNESTDTKLFYLRNKIFSSLNETWSVARMAKEIYMSEPSLYNHYKRVFGISPINDLINKRIEVAKDMLIFDDSSIKKIAYLLGYENVSHFCRQFKSTTGMSPSDYRNNKPN